VPENGLNVGEDVLQDQATVPYVITTNPRPLPSCVGVLDYGHLVIRRLVCPAGRVVAAME
jgi:hypothetical protein